MAKGASLAPKDFTGGGFINDGEHVIESVQTVIFNYGGTTQDTPAIAVEYTDKDGVTATQHYSAGKLDSLVPSDDGKRFVHPSGEEAHIAKSSNAAAWINSIIQAGFPVEKLSDDVTAFVGAKVTVQNVAQPKRPGLKDQVEGKSKTIPLISKVLSVPGKPLATPRTNAAPKVVSKAQAAPANAPAASAASVNGDLGEEARAAVLTALANAPDQTITRLKLGTQVMLTLAKEKNPNMSAIKKLASDGAWLMENAEVGGWTTDGETITIAQ